MEQTNIQKQIDEINRKLDIILGEIELQSRHRREMDDLKEDLTRVGKDVYDTAVLELEEVSDSIDTGDMLHLGKKLLRNVKNITKTFEQLENFKDFINDFSPISRDLFIDFMNKLDQFDRKGYFQFIKELGNVLDNVVTSFSADDVKHLSENIVTILNTVKNLTQPEMLHAVNNALTVYQNLDVNLSERITTFGILKELNKPEVKKGLAFALKFLENLGKQEFKKETFAVNQIQQN
jgi:uncharacterized protein YjgD (DUF1641 family)